MTQPTAEQTVHDQDKAKRLQEEKEVLAKAKHLSDALEGDQKIIGEVLFWQVKESISQGTLIRLLIAGQSLYALKSDCALAHGNKTWVVRVFGRNYSVPVSLGILVIGFLSFMFMRKNGWI